MDKELNEDARTKQDLLYECSRLESKLSNEIIKNEHLEQKLQMQQEQIDKAINDLNIILEILRELKPGRTPNMNKTKISKPMSNNVRNFMKREFDNV